jgi:C1A family cysteine protease
LVNDTKTDHLISIVGWGETKDGVKFWIAKNSWGQFWGEDGFFRIVANRNYLGIESVMTQMGYYDNNFKYAQYFNLEKGPIDKQFYKDAQFDTIYTTLKKFI